MQKNMGQTSQSETFSQKGKENINIDHECLDIFSTVIRKQDLVLWFFLKSTCFSDEKQYISIHFLNGSIFDS